MLPVAVLATLLALGAAPSWSQGPSDKKKEMVARVLQLQVPEIASALVEEPAVAMLQQAAQVVRERVPADQRDAVGKRIQESVKKFVEETTPLLRERAQKLAPSTLGVAIEQKFTEDELKQLLAWLESPVSRKYQQVTPEIQSAFAQKLISETRPLVDPKLKQLDDSIRAALGLPPAATPPKAAPPSASKPAPK